MSDTKYLCAISQTKKDASNETFAWEWRAYSSTSWPVDGDFAAASLFFGNGDNAGFETVSKFTPLW